MTLEKFSRFLWLFFVFLLYDISYKGIIEQSIHENTSRTSINFDGNEAIFLGVITYIAGTYLLYLVINMFRKDKKKKKQ